MKLHALMTGAALTALMAGGAFAQDTATDPNVVPPAGTEVPMDNTAADVAPVFTSIDEMTVGDVLGMVAYDPQGDRIGEIDYVLETDAGVAAVLGIGGFLGLGEYTVALLLEEFELSEDGTFFILNTDKETLKAQTEFDESGAESLPDETPIAQLMEAMPEVEGAETEAEVETEAEAEAEAEMESEAEAETEMESEMESEGEVEGSTGGEVETEVETDMETDTGSTETETEVETETETETDSDTAAPMTTVPPTGN